MSTSTLNGGSNGGAPQPQFVFNGGVTRVTGTAGDAMRLANGSGVQSKMTVNGGLVTVSNTTIRLAENNSSNRGQLVLNGGRLVTRDQPAGGGVGEVSFNGVSCTVPEHDVDNLSAAVVQAGGFVGRAGGAGVDRHCSRSSRRCPAGPLPTAGVLRQVQGTLAPRAA